MALNSSFTVTCLSTNGTGANKYQLKYNFDWNAMPSGKYNLQFAFTSKGAAFGANDIVIVQIPDLGCKLEHYSATSSTSATSAQVNNYLGVVTPSYATGSLQFLFAHYEQNPPIFIGSKPHGNTFTVNLLDNTGVAFYTAQSVDYVLTLYFKKIDE